MPGDFPLVSIWNKNIPPQKHSVILKTTTEKVSLENFVRKVN